MAKAAEKTREFRAEAKFQRTSPQKAKLVLDLIKGLRVEQAINTVHFNNKRIAPVVEKVLRSAIQNANYDQAAELRDRELKLRERIAKLETGWQKDQSSEKPVVDEEHIAQIVSMWTGIPVMRIAQEESARLLEMEGALHKRVIGQNEAIETIARAVRRARAGRTSSSRR